MMKKDIPTWKYLKTLLNCWISFFIITIIAYSEFFVKSLLCHRQDSNLNSSHLSKILVGWQLL